MSFCSHRNTYNAHLFTAISSQLGLQKYYFPSPSRTIKPSAKLREYSQSSTHNRHQSLSDLSRCEDTQKKAHRRKVSQPSTIINSHSTQSLSELNKSLTKMLIYSHNNDLTKSLSSLSQSSSIIIPQSSQLSAWKLKLSVYPDLRWEKPPQTGHFPWRGQIHFVTVPTQKRGFTPFIFNDSLALMPRERDNTHAFLVTIVILFWSFNCWSTEHTLVLIVIMLQSALNCEL